MNLKPIQTLRTDLSMQTLARLEKESDEARDRLIDAERCNASKDVINGYRYAYKRDRAIYVNLRDNMID